MLVRIVHRLLTQLVEEELLVLVPEASMDTLVSDIVQAMPSAQFGDHFGSWFGNILIQHAFVEELFASDGELTDMLRYTQS